MNKFDTINEGIKLTQGSDFNTIKKNEFYTLSPLSPLAVDDSYTTQIETIVEIPVSSNDHDRDGIIDISTISITQMPSHGSATESTNGSIIYQPVMGYNGSDTLYYRIQDDEGLLSNEAKVNILVISDDLGDEIKQEQSLYNRSLSIYDSRQMAQSIRMQPGTLTKTALYLKKIGNPISPIQMQIHKDDINGDIIFSSSRPANEVYYNYDWIIFDDDDIIIEPSSTYYIKVFTSIGNIDNNYQ